MTLNTQPILDQIRQQFTQLAQSDIAIIATVTAGYLESAVVRLGTLTAPDLSQEFIQARLKEEVDIMTSELLSYEVIAENLAADARENLIGEVSVILVNLLLDGVAKA